MRPPANPNSKLRKKVKEISDMMCCTMAGVADELGLNSAGALSSILKRDNASPELIAKIDKLHAEATEQFNAHAKIDRDDT